MKGNREIIETLHETALNQVASSNGSAKSRTDLLERLKACAYDPANPILEPTPIISIQKNIIGTPGNIIAPIGPSKAGKSGFISGVLAGMLRPEGSIVDTLNLEVQPNREGKFILHADSEQSDWNHYKSCEALTSRTGRDKMPEWFCSVRLRQFSPKEKREAVKILLEDGARRFNGVYAIVIDGIADFVESVNDEKEVNEVVNFFEKLAIEYNCVVITVLHYNPGTEKGRGHLGSQLERKCESVLSITKDQDSGVSKIEGKLLRNAGSIPTIEFMYDVEKGYHVSCGIIQRVDRREEKKNELILLAQDALDNGNTMLRRKDFLDKIVELEGCKAPTASKRFTALKDAGIISAFNNKPENGYYLEYKYRMT